MLNFTIKLQSGTPLYEQIVYAVKKAIVSGQLEKGDQFPSVREIAKELKINPNTAQKVVSHLVNEGILEIKPGIGSVISGSSNVSDSQRNKILIDDIEVLVVECKRLLISKKELIGAINHIWESGNKEKIK